MQGRNARYGVRNAGKSKCWDVLLRTLQNFSSIFTLAVH